MPSREQENINGEIKHLCLTVKMYLCVKNGLIAYKISYQVHIFFENHLVLKARLKSSGLTVSVSLLQKLLITHDGIHGK